MHAPILTAPATGAMTGHLRLTDLSKTYAGQQTAAVHQVNLELEQGKLLALLGPSGCGKTTTLRMIAGLIEPSAGRIEVDGRDLTTRPVHKRGMGMVFQSYALFPHLDVARNVAFGLEMRKLDRRERARKVQDALEMVQLGHVAKRRVKELSGGQQQRVALARALVVEPSVLLLDEPLSNLDAKLREAMRTEIRSIVQRIGVTTVFVTHDQDEALSMADEIVVMNAGKVEQIGKPDDIYERPASRFVADFIGRANLLPGRLLAHDGDTTTVEVTGVGTMHATCTGHRPDVGQPVTVLVRPHRIEIAPANTGSATNRLRGTVTAHSYTGELVAYTVAVNDQELEVQTLTGSGADVSFGSEVSLSWHCDDALILPES